MVIGFHGNHVSDFRGSKYLKTPTRPKREWACRPTSKAPTVTVSQKQTFRHTTKLAPTAIPFPQTPTNSSQKDKLRLLDNMPKNKGKVRMILLLVNPPWRGCPTMPRVAMTLYTMHHRVVACTAPASPLRTHTPAHDQHANDNNRVVRTDVGVRTRTTTRSASSCSKRKAKNTPK
jgi:hypothetical protein